MQCDVLTFALFVMFLSFLSRCQSCSMVLQLVMLAALTALHSTERRCDRQCIQHALRAFRGTPQRQKYPRAHSSFNVLGKSDAFPDLLDLPEIRLHGLFRRRAPTCCEVLAGKLCMPFEDAICYGCYLFWRVRDEILHIQDLELLCLFKKSVHSTKTCCRKKHATGTCRVSSRELGYSWELCVVHALHGPSTSEFFTLCMQPQEFVAVIPKIAEPSCPPFPFASSNAAQAYRWITKYISPRQEIVVSTCCQDVRQ